MTLYKNYTSTSWTPAMAGTTNGADLVTSTLQAEYVRIGAEVFYRIHLVVDAANTATGGIRFSLPTTAAMPDVVSGYVAASGEAASGALCDSAGLFQAPYTHGRVIAYNNTAMIASGRRIMISGKYRTL